MSSLRNRTNNAVVTAQDEKPSKDNIIDEGGKAKSKSKLSSKNMPSGTKVLGIFLTKRFMFGKLYLDEMADWC